MLIGIDANEANLTQIRVGINQYALGLLQALYQLDTPHKFVIYLKTPPLPDLPPSRPGWIYRVLPFPKLWTQTRLPFDLYTHSPRPDVFLSLTHYAPRWTPVPNVVAIMDLGFLTSPDQFTSKDLHQLTSWTNYSVKRATKILTISQFTKQIIVDSYHRQAADITIAYPGIDPAVFQPTTNPQVLKKYGITTPYFLFLGSLKPSKNIERLITAFKKLKASPYSLVIAGKKAWLYDQIFQLVSDLKLQSRVIFTGFIEEAEVPVLMSMSSAYVLPSLYEGFGIPVIEAMACGVPVVVSDIASLPEVAGSAGIYVDPFSVDSITTGLETALGPQKQKFVSAGLVRVKSFSWAKTAQATLNLLESIHV